MKNFDRLAFEVPSFLTDAGKSIFLDSLESYFFGVDMYNAEKYAADKKAAAQAARDAAQNELQNLTAHINAAKDKKVVAAKAVRAAKKAQSESELAAAEAAAKVATDAAKSVQIIQARYDLLHAEQERSFTAYKEAVKDFISCQVRYTELDKKCQSNGAYKAPFAAAFRAAYGNVSGTETDGKNVKLIFDQLDGISDIRRRLAAYIEKYQTALCPEMPSDNQSKDFKEILLLVEEFGKRLLDTPASSNNKAFHFRCNGKLVQRLIIASAPTPVLRNTGRYALSVKSDKAFQQTFVCWLLIESGLVKLELKKGKK